MSDRRVDEYAACLERWRDELAALRAILSDTELTEAFKWRKPCYTHAGKNIAIFQPLKDRCALRELVADAIRVQQAGLRVKEAAPPSQRDHPDVLWALMEADPAFRDAFERLTPAASVAICSTSTEPSNQRHARLASSACGTGSWKASECTTERPGGAGLPSASAVRSARHVTPVFA
jgi:uncharacterized protein YdeI (YjbR/CyaY-like superfamily)